MVKRGKITKLPKGEVVKLPQLEDGRIGTAELAPESERCDCADCKEIWAKPVEYPEVHVKRSRVAGGRARRNEKRKIAKKARRKNRKR